MRVVLGGFFVVSILKEMFLKKKIQEVKEEKDKGLGKTPMDILQQRYALGQIDDAEYQRRKSELENN